MPTRSAQDIKAERIDPDRPPLDYTNDDRLECMLGDVAATVLTRVAPRCPGLALRDRRESKGNFAFNWAISGSARRPERVRRDQMPDARHQDVTVVRVADNAWANFVGKHIAGQLVAEIPRRPNPHASNRSCGRSQASAAWSRRAHARSRHATACGLAKAVFRLLISALNAGAVERATVFLRLLAPRNVAHLCAASVATRK